MTRARRKPGPRCVPGPPTDVRLTAADAGSTVPGRDVRDVPSPPQAGRPSLHSSSLARVARRLVACALLAAALPGTAHAALAGDAQPLHSAAPNLVSSS